MSVNLSINFRKEARPARRIRTSYAHSCRAGLCLQMFCALLLVFLTVSCASAPSQENMGQSEAHNKLGYSYLNTGNLNDAFVEFQKSIEMNPRNKEALYYLGYISHRFGKHSDAVTYYKRALAVDPNYSEASNSLGVVYSDMENWDEAIANFQVALSNSVYRTPAWAYSNMGYAYYRKGLYDQAESAVREALIRNPVFPRANYILGLIYVKLNREDDAIDEFKKAIGIQPDYIDAHWELALAYLKTDRNAKALKHFKVVAEKDENISRSREAAQYIEQLKY